MLLAATVSAVHVLALRASVGGADKRGSQGTLAFVSRTIQEPPPEAALTEASRADRDTGPPPPRAEALRPRLPAPRHRSVAPAGLPGAAPAPAIPAGAPAQEQEQEQEQEQAQAALAPGLILETSFADPPPAASVSTIASPPLPPEAGGGTAAAPAGAGSAPAPAQGTLPAASSRHAHAIPAPVRLRYVVAAQAQGIELKGTAELLWRHDGKTYEARLQTQMPLLRPRVQQSMGEITPEGLAPTRYSEKARNEEAAHFERDKNQISFSNNQPAVPLAAGAQDRLSVMLQLGAIIGSSPSRYPPGSTLTVQTASTRDADLWQFTVEAEEELSLPGGNQQALKLVRSPRKPFDQIVELWLAPGMDYVPVRARLTQQNGDRLDQQWASTDRL